MAVCDGHRALPLAPAQDFKRVGDGDQGPNTGGMGAYSPVPQVDDRLVGTVMDLGIEPTLAALRARGIDYRGVLYAGIMLTPDGPKVLEFNVRFGDPETQVVLPRWEGDVADVLASAADGSLRVAPTFRSEAAVAVVAAAEGYPASPRTGQPIEGIEAAAAMDGVEVYAAGVGRDSFGRLTTAGGRVLAVTGVAAGVAEARALAYRGVEAISWAGMNYRRDIAEQPQRVEEVTP
jgi:phosphoribosylamine--glycine ligase